MKNNRGFSQVIIVILIVAGILIVGGGAAYYYKTEKASENNVPQIIGGDKDEEVLSATDKFAKCLTDKGVKMYGASWCPHCVNQKNLFGDSVKYMPYVECAEGNGQAEVCQQAGIQAYPTWIFEGDKKVSGELSFEKISQYSGCPFE